MADMNKKNNGYFGNDLDATSAFFDSSQSSERSTKSKRRRRRKNKNKNKFGRDNQSSNKGKHLNFSFKDSKLSFFAYFLVFSLVIILVCLFYMF